MLLQSHHVHLSFVNFELEEEQDCGYDYIEVSRPVLDFVDFSFEFVGFLFIKVGYMEVIK